MATSVDYRSIFAEAIAALHAERRYRVFTDLERIAGRFPYAIARTGEKAREIVVWCSNDYLGMGQHPGVLAAMTGAAQRMGVGAGGTRNISGTNHPLVTLEAGTATESRRTDCRHSTRPLHGMRVHPLRSGRSGHDVNAALFPFEIDRNWPQRNA